MTTAISHQPSAISQAPAEGTLLVAARMSIPVEAPGRVVICPMGTVKRKDGEDFILDGEAVQMIFATLAADGTDVPIDLEHASLGGKYAAPDGAAPAVGWIKALRIEPAGLVGDVEWTERGAGYVARKEYRYLSPVVMVRKSDGRAVALHSVALTNTPAIAGFPPIVNKDGPEGQQEKGIDMSAVASALGLAADAGTDAVIAAINKLKEDAAEGRKARSAPAGGSGGGSNAPAGGNVMQGNKTHVAICKTLNLAEDADEAAVIAAINSAKANPDPSKFVPSSELAKANERLSALEAETLANKIDAFIKGGLSAGKIVNRTRESWERWFKANPEQTVKDLAAAPVIAPASGVVINTAGKTGAPIGGDGGTDRVAIINSAKAQFEADAGAKAMTNRAAYVSLALRDAGQDPKLSDEEKKLVS